MEKRKPGRDKAARRGSANSVAGTTDNIPFAAEKQPRLASAPALDLPAFRARLVTARARLIERIILEYDPARAYPDTAWTRMVSDLHNTILAVDDMLSEDRR